MYDAAYMSAQRRLKLTKLQAKELNDAKATVRKYQEEQTTVVDVIS